MYYQCNACQYHCLKWVGCCPSCKEWNTLKETTIKKTSKNIPDTVRFISLENISTQTSKRFISGVQEWDRVMGGGIMPGSFIILTGDPGIGKSTLLLQIAYKLANNHKVFYFSSEESLEQVNGRVQRLGCYHEKLLFADHGNIDEIIVSAEQQKPDIIIIDSIQNCHTQNTSTPGSANLLRETAYKLMRLAKNHMIAIILTGHITKEGQIAGPRTLEHMVDAVFYLQGEDRFQKRVLRAVKNRFGTINELGFFEMGEQGLLEIPNINECLLQDIDHAPGSAVISYIEGSRTLLLELQALTIAAKFGVPQRVVTGIDQKQVVLIAAILEKYLQVKFSIHDLFFKIGGGFKIRTSSADLGIALALLSSYFQQQLPEKSLALGEISLTGHIKSVNNGQTHLGEAQKFGIKTFLLPRQQKHNVSETNLITFKHVTELLKLFD